MKTFLRFLVFIFFFFGMNVCENVGCFEVSADFVLSDVLICSIANFNFVSFLYSVSSSLIMYDGS